MAVTLMLIQVVLLNHIYVVNIIVPFIYIWFLLALPYKMQRHTLLLIGFAWGLTIDIFSSTGGLHAAACTFLAFARPLIIRVISIRDYSEISDAPNAKLNGITWFISYIFTSVFIHHIFLYFVESFTFSHIFFTLLKILLGTLITSSLIIIGEYATAKK